jgi:hypothetical protein
MYKKITLGICIIFIILVFSNILFADNITRLANLNLTVNESINRFSIICGNEICELGENKYNCPQDCLSTPFSYKSNLFNSIVSKGQEKYFNIEIKNIVQRKINVNISVFGELSNILFLEKEINDTIFLDIAESKIIFLTANVSGNESNGVKVGGVKIAVQNSQVDIPLSLEVVNTVSNNLELQLFIIGKNIRPNGIIRAQQNIYSYDSATIPLTLEYKIIDSSTQEVIYNDTIEKKVKGSHIHVESIVLNETEIKLVEGTYFLEVSTEHKGRVIVASDDFNILIPFWTPFRVRLAIGFVFLVFSIVVSLTGYHWYRKWKKNKMRYIMPNLELLPKKSEENLWVGKIVETTKKAYFVPRDLCTHVLVAGSTGSGKSVTASVIVEAVLEQKIPVIIFDPTAQWTGFVKQCTDKNILNYYPEFGFKEENAHSFKGLIYNVTDPYIDIDVKKYMNPGEVTVFNLNYLKPGEYDQAVMNIIDKMFQVPWDEHPTLRMLLVFDEVHRLLEKYGGKGGYVALEKACREFRKWGIGLVMASQVSTDFKEAVAGNILTEIQMNTKSMEDIQKIAHKYGEDFSSKVTRQGIGVGMVQNPMYNNGKPWFVQFRPTLHDPHKIPEEDLKMYSDYSMQLDEIEEILNKAKEKGKKVDDIMVEYKLTRGKLKEGHFKMVDIYLSSLKESIKKL